uniref:long-chain-fatty-acid--CoA ligase n=1 Tax=Aceria tosichella TaxID=561515 RepID=A0A6G1SCM7_9ACAR
MQTMSDGEKLPLVKTIEFIVNVYDFITLPIYFIIQKPWQKRKAAARVRAKNIGDSTWVNVEHQLEKNNLKPIETLDQLFRDSVATFAERDCLGVRKILAVEYKDSKGNQDGGGGGPLASKVVSKYVLDDKYTWYSYAQIDSIVVNLSAGLVNLCSDSLKNNDGSRKLLICADTCMQWFLMAHACFRNNVIVVTAYTTLDDEAILHSIQQTEVRILVVSQKFVKRVPNIIKLAPLVDTIIVLDDPLPGCEDEKASLKPLLGSSNVKQILSFDDIKQRGAQLEENVQESPKGDDIAVLMYTSGSTGKAKGVMLTHSNIVYTSLTFRGPDISHEDRYIGYLPLGHVLELAAECIFLRNGSTIAYSSPMTLTNFSPMIKKGHYGDAHIFKPTLMGAVPLVLDRIRDGIQQNIKSQGRFFDQLINDFLIRYKRYWWERHYTTPIMNWLICKKFNMLLGGELRAICSGGAALSRDTQEYLRFVTNQTVLQGYGLTETSAAATFCDLDEYRCNIVGPPYPSVRIKLESWSDYSVNDKPNPRGEIIIGGRPVAKGYYKMDELTRESFFDQDGVRYFRTGDIGMMLPDGCLKIIDRKKDIVKPLSGEYISLSEIENTLRTAPMVENILVYCSAYSNYLVALIKPQTNELRRQAKALFNESSQSAEKFRESIRKARLANSLPTNDANKQTNNGYIQINGHHSDKDQHEMKASEVSSKSLNADVLSELSDEILCSNQWFVEHVLRGVQQEGSRKGLKRTQIPSRIKLVCDEWSPESGLVTASFKLRRREIERHYEADIKQLYAELGQKIEQRSS